MNTLELAAQLEECLQLARKDFSAPDKEMFKSARGMLLGELNTLLQEAVDRKWPFVEEKWQYKRSVASEDKVNTAELIGRHLPQLMVSLKASIMAAEPAWAMSIIFLLDRFLYWTDNSHTLLKIAKALHKRYPETPVAPQIIIRQARVYLNTGKLQQAEYILSSLINNHGSTGSWTYQRDCDRVLVQSVSVQIRGQVLQRLGLWLEAAELIWASLIGFHVLPLPDKKGIGTSLGLLANILISMNDKDFATFQKKPHINLQVFLGDYSHRLLCAAQAAKMAAVYSQFSSLYVLTHMVTQGTCLLSYSFSKDCPTEDKHTYLSLAKEALENGLLTMKDHELVTSQQELHTLLRAAYCLATTNKWMFGSSEQVNTAVQACQEAMGFFYSYSFNENSNKNSLSSEVMARLHMVKWLLKTKPFTHSDPRSFIPDSYRSLEDRPVPFTTDDFAKIMECFQKHHESICEAFPVQKCGGNHQGASHFNCITAVQTQTESSPTECPITSHTSKHQQGIESKPGVSDRPTETASNTVDSEEKKTDNGQKAKISRISEGSSSFESSWTNLSDNSATSPVVVSPFCCTEVDDDDVGVDNKQNRQNDTADASKQNQMHLFYQASGIHPNRDIQKLCTTLESEDNDSSSGAIMCNASQQVGVDISLPSSPSQQNLNQELCTTLESGEYCQISTNGEDNKSRASSGSISSLGSSWQSMSFSNSPQSVFLPKLLENKQAVDQGCDTEPCDSGPGSSFEYLNLNSSTSSIEKEHFNPSCQTGNDASKTQAGRFDHKPSLPSTELDSFEFLQIDPSDATEKNPNNAIKNRKGGIQVSAPVETKDTPYEQSAQMSGKRIENTNHNHCAISKKNRLLRNTNCCNSCFQFCKMGSVILTEQDYRSLLSGVCQGCLLRRLPDNPIKLRHYNKAYSALLLKYNKTTDSWTACETNVYIGEVLKMDVEGKQRQAFRVQYLHQELLLGSYVGKEYLKERKINTHLDDVERQMTAQFYVMEFNKRLYENNITTQIFYLPSELLLLLESDTIVACVSVEPYMLGEFVKLTNNTTKVNNRHSTTEYGIAFGHFTYEFSSGQEVVVDLQGWITANGKGLMYLTDPQIHTLRKPKSVNNFHHNGIKKFLYDQHGKQCNSICMRAALHALPLE